jgi:branched-chain amino acid transport system ATP-binding protein
VVKLGVVQVPEGRQVFAGLTVRENLMAGAYTVNDAGRVPEETSTACSKCTLS